MSNWVSGVPPPADRQPEKRPVWSIKETKFFPNIERPTSNIEYRNSIDFNRGYKPLPHELRMKFYKSAAAGRERPVWSIKKTLIRYELLDGKNPNYKHQIPNGSTGSPPWATSKGKSQIPISNDPNWFGILNFGHWDLFGIWNLQFEISRLLISQANFTIILHSATNAGQLYLTGSYAEGFPTDPPV